MHQISINHGAIEVGAAADCAEHGLKRFRTSESVGVDFEAANSQVSVVHLLITEAPNLHRNQLGQLAREVFDVNACSAIGVWRVFVREEENLQASGVLE